MEINTGAAKQFLEGDDRAFEEIYNSSRRLLYFIIISILKDPSESEDVLQEVFANLLAKRPKVKPSKLQSYLCQSAKNAAINTAKRRDSLIDYSDLLDVYGEEDHDNPYLQNLLEGLTDRENIIVVYKIVYGFSFREIARLTGISRQSANTLYKTALKKMRKTYGDNPYDQQQ